jgi:hypothetical protein
MALDLETTFSSKLTALRWGLPMSSRLGGGQGKWLLRQVLFRDVPDN